VPIIWVFVIVWSGTSIAEASQPDFEISWPYMVKDIFVHRNCAVGGLRRTRDPQAAGPVETREEEGKRMLVERLMLLFVGAGLGIIGFNVSTGWTIGVTIPGVIVTVGITIARYNHRRKQPAPKQH
jgi:hypothetical protein